MRSLSAASYDLLQRAGFFTLLTATDQRDRFTAAVMWIIAHDRPLDFVQELVPDALLRHAKDELWKLAPADLAPVFDAINKSLMEVNAAFVTTDPGESPLA